MKTSVIKTTLATLAAWSLAGASFAEDIVIRIVASNGDRLPTQTAISNLLDAGWTYQGLSGGATSANLSTATGSNFGAWKGTRGGKSYIIKTSYAGALAGDSAIAGNTDQRFVVSDGTGSTALPNPLNGTTPGVDYEVGKADFGFSTNFQSTTPFLGTYQGITYNPIVEEIVGVSPLGFYASPGFPGSNITTQLAQLLYTTGTVSVALFTGDFTNDANKVVYAIGRNTDAGQRFGAYTEIGLGAFQAVRVWQPTVTGQTTASGITYGGTANSHILWPAETVSGIFSPIGSGGYSSGALVAEKLTVVLGPDAYKGKYRNPDTGTDEFLFPDATAGYYIGYVTTTDANPRILGTTGIVPVENRGKALTYNGVALTDDNVRTGRYTAWLYNRILKPQSGLTGDKLLFANDLRDRLRTVDAANGGGLLINAAFKVQRFTDGGLVTPR